VINSVNHLLFIFKDNWFFKCHGFCVALLTNLGCFSVVKILFFIQIAWNLTVTLNTVNYMLWVYQKPCYCKSVDYIPQLNKGVIIFAPTLMCLQEDDKCWNISRITKVSVCLKGVYVWDEIVRLS